MTVSKPILGQSKATTTQGVYKMKESNVPVSVDKSKKRFERMINKNVPPGGKDGRRSPISSQPASEDDGAGEEFEEKPQEENIQPGDGQEHTGAKNGALSTSNDQAKPVADLDDSKDKDLTNEDEKDSQNLHSEKPDSDSSDSEEESQAWKSNVSVESVMTDQNEISKILEMKNVSEKEGKNEMSRDGSLKKQTKGSEPGESNNQLHVPESSGELQANESDKKLSASESDESAQRITLSNRNQLADAISKSLNPIKKDSEQTSDNEDDKNLKQVQNPSELDTDQETMDSEFVPKVSVSTSFNNAPVNKSPNITDNKSLQPELEVQPSRATSATSQNLKPPNDIEKNKHLTTKAKKKCCGLC